jgi:D-alanyl-lipoteichoic acid acyltransferase DltB (MBOAT superfamily)
MGIEPNVNFLFPYFVISPQEFWRHWHISLSTWLRDYLYIPLGGNRGGEARTTRNLLITMVLGGLWHGAAWTFVTWGFYQGVVLIIARQLSRLVPWTIPRGLSWQRVLLAVGMFQVTCYGWLIFRADSFDQLARFTRLIVTDLRVTAFTINSLLIPILQIVLPLLVVHVFQARRGSELAPVDLPVVVRYALYGAVFYLVLLFGDFEGAQFIYFQF